MNIYIASKFENVYEVALLAADLEAVGHRITYKWWELPQDKHASTTPWEGPEADELHCKAKAEVDGVIRADVLVLIPQPNMRGAWTEFGIAVGTCVPVIVLDNQHARGCIFERLLTVSHAKSPIDVLRILESWEHPR